MGLWWPRAVGVATCLPPSVPCARVSGLIRRAQAATGPPEAGLQEMSKAGREGTAGGGGGVGGDGQVAPARAVDTRDWGRAGHGKNEWRRAAGAVFREGEHQSADCARALSLLV